MAIRDRWMLVVSMLQNFLPLVGRIDSACNDNHRGKKAGTIKKRGCPLPFRHDNDSEEGR